MAGADPAEVQRLAEASRNEVPWRKWGPYLSERQWGTVREDYSADGNAWNYFTHDQARSRAYRWGEDGLAGFADEKLRLCFALALWNGKDPILKERLFGLTNSEGNHGEDVKEYYFYLDSTPTHSYMKYLYKYPQAAFPYSELVSVNKDRTRTDPEYELIDTGIFNDDRYFDVFVEYAKKTAEDILIEISIYNRGPEKALLTVLPTLWFRNFWSWSMGKPRPTIERRVAEHGSCLAASHTELGTRYLYFDGATSLLFTENDTNNERIFGKPNSGCYLKDAFHNYIVHNQQDAVNPEQKGTKAAGQYRFEIKPESSATIRLRLTTSAPENIGELFDGFNEAMQLRRREADEFYRSIVAPQISSDKAAVIRQALAGMLWTKQYFSYDVEQWLAQHGTDPMEVQVGRMRNSDWFHMMNDNIISMPDKWEYPWFASWDLAFHSIALSTVDLDFAKDQLDLLLRDFFLHPSGQLPAYEWNFSDVNPPVHAWAAIFLHRMEQALRGQADLEFLKRCFTKLMLNFGWWVNRKDRYGNNLFAGGFLGLDNIGVFDRSAPLPGGGHLEQADGTAWMALFCQNMLEIAVEIASHEHGQFEEMATKFADHFLWIAHAMNQVGKEGMWDEEDGFYYDVLRQPNGTCTRIKVRSLVGLLPLCATTAIDPWQRESVPRTITTLKERLDRLPQLRESIHPTGAGHLGVGGRDIIALVNPARLRRILSRMLDENEFLSPYGIRSLSKYHESHPYVLAMDGQNFEVRYLPAESDSGMFGGNSNWRGPVWMPINALIIRALLSFYLYYGDNFKVEFPTGSRKLMNLFEVAREIADRLARIFLKDATGRRPVYGGTQKFQTDPYWKDLILFYEYFHGDNGAGIGASHQTGWTGLIAKLIEFFSQVDRQSMLSSRQRIPYTAAQAVAGVRNRVA